MMALIATLLIAMGTLSNTVPEDPAAEVQPAAVFGKQTASGTDWALDGSIVLDEQGRRL